VFTDGVTCKCTRADHGFVDYNTGKRVEHVVRKPVVNKLGLGRGHGKPTAGRGNK
jgi:hypothetical protein